MEERRAHISTCTSTCTSTSAASPGPPRNRPKRPNTKPPSAVATHPAPNPPPFLVFLLLPLPSPPPPRYCISLHRLPSRSAYRTAWPPAACHPLSARYGAAAKGRERQSRITSPLILLRPARRLRSRGGERAKGWGGGGAGRAARPARPSPRPGGAPLARAFPRKKRTAACCILHVYYK